MFIESQNIIYLHPGKTGGTTVENILIEHFQPSRSIVSDDVYMERCMIGFIGKRQLYHLAIPEAIRHLTTVYPRLELAACYKFATVRNPYTRTYSAYTYNTRLSSMYTFSEWVMEKLEKNVERYDRLQIPNWFRSQHTYTHLNGELFVDDICKMETFERDITRIFNKLGIRDVKVPHINRRDYDKTAPYTDEMREVIRRVYAKDFELLGYSDTQ